MSDTLEGLIEKIKQEGILEAKKISSQIIENAKQEAEKIIKDAKGEASRIVSLAKEETQQFQERATSAIAKAARDTVLVVREKLILMCEELLKKKVSQALGDEFLKDMILKVVENWPDGKDKLTVVLSKNDAEKMKDFIIAQVKEAAKKKITISVDDNIEKGFRIGVEGEDVYYDFSDESITEAFKVFLNPHIREILEKNG